MTEDRVQIVIRTTQDEREQIRIMAQKKDTSMNQFILDAIFDSKDDSTYDSSDIDNDIKSDIKIVEILEGQLSKKDEQIEKMQTLLDQQQQLTLQANRQIEQLQLAFTQENNEPAETKIDETASSDPDKEQTESPRQNQKKSIFNRLFNR